MAKTRRPRKPRPTLIFREEVTHPDPRFNSTRQTFDRQRFDDWRRLPREPETTVSFAVGQITWADAT